MDAKGRALNKAADATGGSPKAGGGAGGGSGLGMGGPASSHGSCSCCLVLIELVVAHFFGLLAGIFGYGSFSGTGPYFVPSYGSHHKVLAVTLCHP